MAKLEYDETGRLLFTQEMRKEYTILIPQMLPIHFGLFAKLLERTGYKVAILNNDGRSVVESGLKYVHNDACYPALLVIGQMIDAIQNQGYDPHKVALLITQTGGGCRASARLWTRRGCPSCPSSPCPSGWRRTPASTGPLA